MTGEATFSCNGVERHAPPGTTIGDLVDSLLVSANGCAVARNGDVVPRSQWPDVVIEEGDAIDVLSIVQGG